MRNIIGTRTISSRPGGLAYAAICWVALGACERERSQMTGPSQPPAIAAYLSSEVAGQLDGGRLRLAEPRAPDDIPIISPERARELAAAFLRTWGRREIPRWAWERNQPIDESSVTPGEAAYFAASPRGRIPNDVYHPAIRRMYGPMYLVPLIDHTGASVALLAVSAYATDLQIDTRGLIVSPPLGGSYFFVKAVAPNPVDPRFKFVPFTPEEAVAYVGERTGARLQELPELVLMPPFHPAYAQWRLRLERPVWVQRKSDKMLGTTVQPGEGAFAVRELFVGPDGEITVSRPGQPSHERVGYAVGPPDAQGNSPHSTAQIPRRDAYPVVFDAVRLAEERRP